VNIKYISKPLSLNHSTSHILVNDQCKYVSGGYYARPPHSAVALDWECIAKVCKYVSK